MLNAENLAHELANALEIPNNPKLQAFARALVNHFRDNAEISIDDVSIQVNNIVAGTESAPASKSGKGRIQ